MNSFAGSHLLALTVALLAAGTPVRPADCNGNGIEDAIDVEPRDLGFEYMGKRKAGGASRDAAVADMNGDGAPDVVSLRESGIFVFLQVRPWILGDPIGTELSLEQIDLAAGDLDGDGVPEVVTIAKDRALVLRSRGDGGLEVRQSILIGSGPLALVLADLNGDGHLDLATANGDDSRNPPNPTNVSISLNDGSGSLATPRNFAAGKRPSSLLDAADLDGDGDIDLAFLDPDPSGMDIVVLKNDGGGTFGAAARSLLGPGQVLNALFLVDLDGDADQDAFLTRHRGELVIVLRNQGEGTFVFAGSFPTTFAKPQILVEDFDGDGDPDLVAAGDGCTGLALFTSAAGDFGEPRPLESGRGHALLLRSGDFDGDGRLDVAGLGLSEAVPEDENEVILLRSARVGTSTDCDLDGIPDECEADCNSSRRPDACEIAAGTSMDIDGNAVPDECDPDCDGSGTPDAWDLAVGAAPDCDQNGIPDACDIALDRNRNGVPDACDIADLTSADCDRNGVPDESELEPRLTMPHRGIEWDFPSADPAVPGDFDGDGRTDLLIRGSSGIFLLRNLGAPLPVPDFHESRISADPAQVLEVLDLEGDGDLDAAFVTKDRCRTAVVLLENQGKGQFRRSATYPFGSWAATDLVPADIDRDGKVDLLALSESIWLLRGLGDGTFERPAAIVTGFSESLRLLTFHADSDGDLDLATDTGLLFLGEEGLRFAPPAAFPSKPGLIAALDIDVDGDKDIVTRGEVALNLGEGRSWGWLRLGEPNPLSVRDILVADFDGDGEDDLATSISPDIIRVYRHRGEDLQRVDHRGLLSAAEDLAAGDFDGDGRIDLVSADDFLGIHPNAGDGNFDAPRTLAEGTGLMDVGAADLDGDGDLDLVAREDWPVPTRRILLFKNAGDGAFSHTSLPYDALHVNEADVDGDGDPDILAVLPRELRVLVNDGSGNFTPQDPLPVPHDAFDVTAADLDGRGDIDFVIYDGLFNPPAEGVLLALRGPGGALELRPVLQGEAVGPVLPGDLDGDGDLDLVLMLEERLIVMRNAGEAEFLDPVPIETGGLPRGALLADLTGDGSPDLVVSECFSCDGDECDCGALLSILTNDGTGHFGAPVPYPMQWAWSFLAAEDLDLDGDLDLVLPRISEVEVLLNRGDGTLVSWGVIPVGGAVRSLAAGRLDGDAYPDLAIGIEVYVAPSYLARGTIIPMRVSTADADGNGTLDACETGGFRRGDWNQDGVLNLSDPISLLGSLFRGEESFGCEDAGDADDDGRLAITDAIRILSHLFLGGAPPEEPFERCLPDPTRDDWLSCADFRGC